MANDKSFKIKNGLSATRYLGTNGTETAGTNGPYGVFSTTAYTGNGSTQTITNGIDLAGDGGLVWAKARSQAYPNAFFDTERGALKYLDSGSTSAEITGTNNLTAFNNNGFTLGADSNWVINKSGTDYCTWTFRKAPRFFDVVTWTGDGTEGRAISHSLGSTPACIIIKRTDTSAAWTIFHRGLSGGITGSRILFDTSAATSSSNITAVDDSTFTVISTGVNNTGGTYVAYLFAHDTSDDGYIQCGSYTGNGSATGPEIDLGWEPSWIMIKSATYAGQGWYVWDNVRGIASGSDPILQPHLSDAETNVNWLDLTSTGFTITDNGYQTNKSGETYIYMAIRSVVSTQTLDLSTGHTFSITPTDAIDVLFSNPPASGVATGFTVEVNNSAGGYALTWPSSVKWHLGTAPTATASKEVYTFITTDGGTTYYGKKAGENLA